MPIYFPGGDAESLAWDRHMSIKFLIFSAWMFLLAFRQTADDFWRFCLVYATVLAICTFFLHLGEQAQIFIKKEKNAIAAGKPPKPATAGIPAEHPQVPPGKLLCKGVMSAALPEDRCQAIQHSLGVGFSGNQKVLVNALALHVVAQQQWTAVFFAQLPAGGFDDHADRSKILE